MAGGGATWLEEGPRCWMKGHVTGGEATWLEEGATWLEEGPCGWSRGHANRPAVGGGGRRLG